MRKEILEKIKKWSNRTLVSRVILPLIISAVALYILVVLKHWGYIH